MKYKSVFVSDIHLGYRYSASKAFKNFLKEVECENLFLVGDIIDGLKVRNWKFKNSSWGVLEQLAKKVHNGTKVVYLVGNHDEFLVEFTKWKNNWGPNFTLCKEYIHTLGNGEKVLLLHGDVFDILMYKKYSKILTTIGDKGYDAVIWANAVYNKIRYCFRLKPLSLAKKIKASVKSAMSYISDFEDCVCEYASQKGCKQVICGHIHTPALGRIKKGVTYNNCGSWIESEHCTFLAESESGTLSLEEYTLEVANN